MQAFESDYLVYSYLKTRLLFKVIRLWGTNPNSLLAYAHQLRSLLSRGVVRKRLQSYNAVKTYFDEFRAFQIFDDKNWHAIFGFLSKMINDSLTKSLRNVKIENIFNLEKNYFCCIFA